MEVRAGGISPRRDDNVPALPGGQGTDDLPEAAPDAVLALADILQDRALQGAGAISAAVTALLADLTREEKRTQAMAMIGGTK